MVDLVGQESKKEFAKLGSINYLTNLKLNAQKSGFSIAEGSTLQSAAVAVTSGAIKDFKAFQTSGLSLVGKDTTNPSAANQLKTFNLAASGSEIQFLNLLSKGQLKGLAWVNFKKKDRFEMWSSRAYFLLRDFWFKFGDFNN